MSKKMAAGSHALAGLEDTTELPLAWRGTVHAPLRRLFPFSLFVAIVIGLAVGLAIGVPSNLLGYYLFKEGLNGVIGGTTAPLFLWVGRQLTAQWRGQQRKSTLTIENVLYSVSGALAGCLMIPMQWVLPPLIPLGPWVVFYPISTAALFPIIGAMADYVQLQQFELEQTKELFGKYVSESVARRILEERNHITLTGEKRHCTVLFSDIRGFTRMVKDLGPEEVVRTLNEYFARMIDIVFQFNGTINKFIGDGIVVLYGAPVTLGDEALHAVHTAQEMQRALKEINIERVAQGKLPIRIGIGIDSGEVVVGNIGSTRRLEYTAIGTPVNSAYFLGSLAPPDAVLITENACAELQGRVQLQPWKTVQLKHASGEVMVYTLERIPAGGE